MRAPVKALAIGAALAATLAAAGDETPGYSGPATLAGLARHALAHNPRLQGARSSVEAARAEVDVRSSRLFPGLSATAELGRERTRSKTARTPLFFGGTEDSDSFERAETYGVVLDIPVFNRPLGHSVRGGKMSLRAAESSLESETQVFLADLVETWVDWQLTADRLDLLRLRLESLDSQLRFAKQMVEEDVGDPLDLDLIAVEREDVLIQVADTRLRQSVAANSLADLLAVDELPGEFPRLREDFLPDVPKGLETWTDQVLAGNHDRKTARAQSDALSVSVREAKSRRLPEVNLVTQQTHGKDADSTFIGIQVQIRPFSGGLVDALSTRRRHEHLAAVKEEQRIEQAVRTDTANEHGTAALAAQNTRTRLSIVESRTRQLEKTTTKWREGHGSAVAVLDAEEEKFDAEIALRAEKFRYLLAMARLHALAGRLDEEHIRAVSGLFVAE